MRRYLYKIFIPIILFLFLFIILTYPTILKFSTHLFADTGDGLQGVWNIWWVNKSITELHQWPWYTNYLHFPHGTTLIGHTLCPLKGFLAIPLLKFLSLTQTYNFLVIFSFVVGGLTAFLLSYHLSKSYWGSLLAGFIFSFSNYHFAHAQGHLQLISLEWLPLFILTWLLFLQRPSILLSLGSALTLLAVVLCDYYYFFYGLIWAGLWFLWMALKKRNLFFLFSSAYFRPFLGFCLFSLFSSGILIFMLLYQNHLDPFLGAHDSKTYSLDLLAPLIPGGHWRLAHLTKFYWSKLPANIHETSVHLGLTILFLLVLVWINRRKWANEDISFWYLALFIFWLLSLGPSLRVWGKEISWIKLPYGLLEHLLPPLKLSGMPIRMIIMVILCASVISSFGFKALIERRSHWKFGSLLAGLLCLLFIEYLPQPIPVNKIDIPNYVKFLAQLKDNKGVIDAASGPCMSLYFQTIHEKPLGFGYIARMPTSVDKRDKRISQLIEQGEFDLVFRAYHFRYFIFPGGRFKVNERAHIKIIFNDGQVQIYELGVGLPN